MNVCSNNNKIIIQPFLCLFFLIFFYFINFTFLYEKEKKNLNPRLNHIKKAQVIALKTKFLIN